MIDNILIIRVPGRKRRRSKDEKRRRIG